MENKENIVKSENIVAVKKAVAKKPIKEKVEKIAQEVSIQESKINAEGVVVYFESGAGYVMNNGFTFSRKNTMAKISTDEANLLLRLSNFRLASDEEKEVYYNSQEG